MKIKYIKACPFLRDLGDSYLCVNNDKVADVILDPLMHIDWSEELPPVASEMENIITSPRDGIIKSIFTKKGEAVEKNYLLIEFES